MSYKLYIKTAKIIGRFPNIICLVMVSIQEKGRI